MPKLGKTNGRNGFRRITGQNKIELPFRINDYIIKTALHFNPLFISFDCKIDETLYRNRQDAVREEEEGRDE